VPRPRKLIDATPKALAAAVLKRANRSPALWQQTGFLCDVIVRTGAGYEYFEDMVTQEVHGRGLARSREYHIVTLEFGLEIIFASPDPLAVDRVHKDDIDNSALSTGIHPIIRSYSEGRLVSEHHVIEDIIPEWDEPVTHIAPLERYFGRFARQSTDEVSLPAA
jgi:hypothetical protein